MKLANLLLNIVIDFNAKDFYYHSLKVIIFGRGFWVYSMHILNLIQDSMIYNCAAVFQTHRNGYQKNDSQQDANTCIYSPRQLALIEQRCCSGSHLGCHLWFTHGEHPPGQAMSADTQRLFEQAAQQAKRNRAAYDCESELHQSALVRLTEQIRNCMLIHQQPEDLLARKGRLDGTRVWRTPVLQDGRVFLRKDEESRAGFTVDLMLDASASRLRCQESIAIEGYILAKSLAACGIPVRVTSFCSLRGYTVLHILKDFGDKNGERRVLRCAAWASS